MSTVSKQRLRIFKPRARCYHVRLFIDSNEIWVSLRTKDRTTAKLRADSLVGRISSAKLIHRGRLDRLRGRAPQGMSTFTRDDMRRIVRQWVKETIEEAEDEIAESARITDSQREGVSLCLSDAFDNASDQLLTNNLKPIEATVDTLLATHGLTLEKDSTDYRVFSRLVLKGRMKALQEEAKRWDGEDEGEDVEAVYHHPATDTTAKDQPQANSQETTAPLSEVIEAYFKEHKREPRTDSQIRRGYERFIEAIGGDRPIADITKAQCRTYKERMAAEGLSPASMNKYLHGLSHLLAWAKGQGYVPDAWANPVEGLRIKKQRGDKRQKRSVFTDDELALIFNSPYFLKERATNPARFWLPLCLLWSGARREEIAQLYLDDVRKQDGVWVFDIKADEARGQGVKNEASVRLVPVHSRLVELGFLDYVNEQGRTIGKSSSRQSKAVGRLFPTLEHGGNGYGDSVGKFFGRHLRKIGIIDPTKVMHSLRHTTITRLHSRGVPENIAEALAGHAANTVHGSVYVHREALPLVLLRDGIEKLDYGDVVNGLPGDS